jgi:signal transduction histidine kinase
MKEGRRLFGSYRSKLQTYLLLLGVLAIGATYWQASSGAAAALRQNTYDRLTAIRETKRGVIEDFFLDLNARVLALSTDESTVAALEQFRDAWSSLPAVDPGDSRHESLLRFYRDAHGPTVAPQIDPRAFTDKWLPRDPQTRGAQYVYIAGNPHPAGSKDLLLKASDGSEYSRLHARYHPTFHRYLTAFNFYDIFLIDAKDGRILYTVSKEIDLGMKLTEPPYNSTTLARAYEQAMELPEADRAVITDYAPYMPSRLTPAAFVATPVWRAGLKIGVIAIQVSTERVNRVMTSDRHWQEEGLGRTGQAYITGRDWTLRSDLRSEIEDPKEFFSQLQSAGFSNEVIERIRRNKTAILNLHIPNRIVETLSATRTGTEIGRNVANVKVIRSYAPLRIPGLDWMLFAEMEVDEAFAPVAALQNRLIATGFAVTLLFVAAAWILSRSVTRPILALAEGARRLGAGDFEVRLRAESTDEIGLLAESFNDMTERLKQTTVSRDDLDRVNQELHGKQRELQNLAARLIHAQEEERARLARELHDDLTQRLAAVAIAAGTLRRNIHVDDGAWRAGLEKIQQQLVELSNDVHGLSRSLHPKTLEDLGLVAAIEGECRGFFERTGTPVDFRHAVDLGSPAPDVQLVLYRIVQEGLRNAARHSDASDVKLRLDRRDGLFALVIEDNGRGFDRNDSSWRPGLGLASMSERARLIGGTMAVEARPGAGTRVLVEVPENGE